MDLIFFIIKLDPNLKNSLILIKYFNCVVTRGIIKKNFGHEAGLRKNRKNLTHVLKKLKICQKHFRPSKKKVKFGQKHLRPCNKNNKNNYLK